MNASKLQVKIFADPAARPEGEELIPVFHGWIKHHVLPEMLVDVANYAHVPNGPGVGVIGHASDYFFDESEGRSGLLYSRKREAAAAGERVTDAFRRVVHAALLLEKEPALAGKLRFRTNELLFRINDRLLAPNNDATYAAVKGELEPFLTTLLGETKLTRVGDAKQLFGVRIEAKSAPALPALLEKLGGPPV